MKEEQRRLAAQRKARRVVLGKWAITAVAATTTALVVFLLMRG